MIKSSVMILCLLMSTALYAQGKITRGNKKIEACAGANETVCVGKLLNQKMNRILNKLNKGNGGGGNTLGIVSADIKLTDHADCSGTKSAGAILATNLQEVKDQCESVSQSYSGGFQNVDGIVINGTCYDIENSSDYQLGNLVNICAAKVVSAN